MHVTSHDVAARAGVSQPTVSRALRDDPRVSAQTRERVREAAAALNYVPLSVGRSLSTRATGQVAMVADLGNPLYPSLMGPIHDELSKADLRLLLLAGRSDDEVLSRHLLDRSVDGVILATAVRGSRLPKALHQRGVPFCFLNRAVSGVSADRITSDNLGGGEAVADLLLSLGHREFAAVMGPSETSTARDRERGFTDRLRAAGVQIPPDRLHHGGYGHQDGVTGFEEVVLGARVRPTALFCVNDFVAVGALNAAMAAGVRVPQDLSVVGFDDMEIGAWPAFSLTSVHVPVAEMARASARQLMSRIAGEGPPRAKHRLFGTSLVLRGTHAAPPG